MITTLLGGLSPARFLEEYWQKKPLLVRQAIPGFTGLVSRDRLFELACDADVESRLIRCVDGAWSLRRGPQVRSALRGRKHPWTVLVQGLNLFEAGADALLHQFHFIPQARLDDLMVSYAVDGGGVGPHFDHYDVFLLQGTGKRRWQIANQNDRTLVPDAPLKILQRFEPVHDWVLEPGDMLYLPPHWAHNGIAIGECTTYSVGFRSPTAQELATDFLGWLQERIRIDGLYADPDLALQTNSALIAEPMITRIETMLDQIRWSRADVSAFLGQSLTEPKPHVFFEPPEAPLSRAQFAIALSQEGYRLDARTLLLFTADSFYLNGEALVVADNDRNALEQLADQRQLDAHRPPSPALESMLYDWYCDGFAHLGNFP